MNWKRKIAKEWLWFVFTIVGGFLFWSIIFAFFLPRASVLGDYWEPLFSSSNSYHDVALFFTLVPILLTYFIRISIWAIKELRRQEAN